MSKPKIHEEVPATEPRRTAIEPEVKILDERDGLVEYVASDEAVDSYREVIKASGWKFNRFKKNAPFVDSHNYWSVDALLGRVTDFRVQGSQLIEQVRWAIDVEENALARLGWKMLVGGYLPAVSVGFFTMDGIGRGEDGFLEALGKLKTPVPDRDAVRFIHLSQEQIELSAVIIGANPNALMRAEQGGAIAERDLAACGWLQDDGEFLGLAARSHEAAGPVEQMLIRRELGRLYQSRPGSSGRCASGATSDPAPEANGRTAEREEFLSQLRALSVQSQSN